MQMHTPIRTLRRIHYHLYDIERVGELFLKNKSFPGEKYFISYDDFYDTDSSIK
jgi:hypothetical protein